MDTPFNRTALSQRLLGSFRGQKVLVIGIGGGGDVVGALPVYFELERIGAYPIAAGLTWKREVHDLLGRPRPLSLFNNCTRINDLIGEASPRTTTSDGSYHIEALLSQALDGAPVAMIDIGPGVAQVTEAIRDYMRRRGISALIGVDAGGDVLCVGDEPTLESPICDQVMLRMISRIPNSLLGVFGFGADGEMTIPAFATRFSALASLGCFLGTIPIHSNDIPRIERILTNAPTEASRLPMVIAHKVSQMTLEDVSKEMGHTPPILTTALQDPFETPMRHGTRTARLCPIAATTMIFRPEKIAQSSLFWHLFGDEDSVDMIHVKLAEHGITTEFTAKERLLIKGSIIEAK